VKKWQLKVFLSWHFSPSLAVFSIAIGKYSGSSFLNEFFYLKSFRFKNWFFWLIKSCITALLSQPLISQNWNSYQLALQSSRIQKQFRMHIGTRIIYSWVYGKILRLTSSLDPNCSGMWIRFQLSPILHLPFFTYITIIILFTYSIMKMSHTILLFTLYNMIESKLVSRVSPTLNVLWII
jgi:hypothetical protein